MSIRVQKTVCLGVQKWILVVVRGVATGCLGKVDLVVG
jgi:hypothetical protein